MSVSVPTLRQWYEQGHRLVAEDFERLADADGLWTCLYRECEGKPRHTFKSCEHRCRRATCQQEGSMLHVQNQCPLLGRIGA